MVGMASRGFECFWCEDDLFFFVNFFWVKKNFSKLAQKNTTFHESQKSSNGSELIKEGNEEKENLTSRCPVNQCWKNFKNGPKNIKNQPFLNIFGQKFKFEVSQSLIYWSGLLIAYGRFVVQIQKFHGRAVQCFGGW